MADGDRARPGRPDGFDVYPAGNGPLFDRAVEVWYCDKRVRGRWLHGVFGRGGADAASDMDVTVAVADNSFDEFAGSWHEWLTPSFRAASMR